MWNSLDYTIPGKDTRGLMMTRLPSVPLLSRTVLLSWILLPVLIKQSSCEFSFSSQNAFDLSVDNRYPKAGEDVTLKCRKRRDSNTVTVGTSLLGTEDNVVSWEENDRTVLTTNVNDRGGCTVIIDSRFTGGSTFESGRNRLSKTSCEYDDAELVVRLKIEEWTPAHLSGDRWRCLQFPFAESKSVEILSFVPVTSVSIQQDIDRFNTPSRGTIVTCISSPSRPAPQVTWYIDNEDGSQVQVTMQADLKENVETDFNGLSVTTSSVLFSHDEDHGTLVFCKTLNKRKNNRIHSDLLTLVVKYPPSVEIHADPGASILEDTDVSLHCIVIGRPLPSVQWTREGDNSEEAMETEINSMIISIEPTLVLQSVTLKDSGKYECVASNGIGPDVTAPIFLFVREKPASDEQRPVDDDSSGDDDGDDSENNDQGSVSDSGYSSTIVGSVTTTIAVVVVVAVVAFLFVRRRWGKHSNIVVHGTRHSINSSNDGQAIYATCSSIPGNSELPPYVDVLPPAYKLSNITNPGYEVVDNVIGCRHHNTVSPRSNHKRPLPSTPPPGSDYGYEEIKEEGGRRCRTTLRRPTTPSSTAFATTRNHTIHSGYINNSSNDRNDVDSGYVNTDSDTNNLADSRGNSSNPDTNTAFSISATNSTGKTTTTTTSTDHDGDECKILGSNSGSSYAYTNTNGKNVKKDGGCAITIINTGGGGGDGGGGGVGGGAGGYNGGVGGGGVGGDGVGGGGVGGGVSNYNGGCGGGGGYDNHGVEDGNDNGNNNHKNNDDNDDGGDGDGGSGNYSNGGYHITSRDNSGTLPVRAVRQENGGYEVPVLPSLQK